MKRGIGEDDELCLCFHVTRRKVESYIRIHRPRVASQLSECGGAGTGCGWCRPMLRRLLARASQGEAGEEDVWPDAEQYAAGREQHLKSRET